MRKSLSNILANLSGPEAILNYVREMALKMPDANDYREIMEKHIATLPDNERPEAQQRLDETLAKYPSNKMLKTVMDDINGKLDPEKLNEPEITEISEYLKHKAMKD